MLKKMLALATTTAMLGANAAAYAVNSVRSAVRSAIGVADEVKPGDGRNILPTIPPMPPEDKAKGAVHKTSDGKAVAAKPAKAKRGTHKARVSARSGGPRRKGGSRSK